jgi:hypothetical protein
VLPKLTRYFYFVVQQLFSTMERKIQGFNRFGITPGCEQEIHLFFNSVVYSYGIIFKLKLLMTTASPFVSSIKKGI